MPKHPQPAGSGETSVMDAKVLGRVFKKGSPEWRLVMKWALFVGKKGRSLPPKERGIWDKRKVTGSLFVLVASIQDGDLDRYTKYLRFGWYDDATRIVMAFWDEFRRVERNLCAEVLLSR